MTLSLKNVAYSFKNGSVEKPVVKELTMDIQQGEFVSLVGVSGSGKSTILKLIAGLLDPDQGCIHVGGLLARPGMAGYMPQKDLLLPWRTVLENIALPGEIMGEDKKATEKKAMEWILRTGLQGCEFAYPRQLSGGMRQRAAFLRTMMTGRDVLLLDEPFGALDALTKRDMHSWLLSIWAGLNKTIVLITHDLEEAVLLSDRVYILQGKQGQVQDMAIDLPRPRTADMIHTTRMLDYRKELERRIHDA